MPNDAPTPDEFQRLARALGLNLHARDNLLQLAIVLVCAGIGAAVSYFTGMAEDLVGGANTALGGVIGAGIGLVGSGTIVAMTRSRS